MGMDSDEETQKRIHAQAAQFEGQWVVFDGERLVATGCGNLLREMVQKARDEGCEVPYVFFVEPAFDGAKLGL